MRTVTRMICVVMGAGLLLALPRFRRRACTDSRSLSAGAVADAGGGGGRGQMEVWSPMPVKANPFVPPNKALTESRPARQAQGSTELDRGHRPRSPVPRRVHLDGARREDAEAVPSGQPRVLDRPGRADSLHDRRAGAVCRVEGIPRAGAEAPGLQHGDGRRQAVAAVRSDDGEFADDVSGRRDTDAGAWREVREGERCEREGLLRRRQRAVHRLQPDDRRERRSRRATRRSSSATRTTAATSTWASPTFMRGDPKTQKPALPDDKGHFHLTGPEFWFMLEGQNEFLIGECPLFVAEPGRHRLRACADVASPAPRRDRDGDEAGRRGIREFARLFGCRRSRE